MPPTADHDRELLVEDHPYAQEHVILELKEGYPNPLLNEEEFKDGADLFGPTKMQELHRHLMQQHELHRHQEEELPTTTILPEVHMPQKKEPSLMKKGGSLLLWFLFNSLTLILNKYLFSVMDFHYPLTLTAVHMVTCFAFSYLLTHVLKVVPYQTMSRHDLLTKILPLSIVFCTNIVFGNFSIRWIPISFMQTVKSSVPAFTVVLQYLILKKTSSKQVYLSLIPVVGGVALASCTEINFVMGGFLCALFGSFLTSLQAVILHSSAVKLDAVNLILYTSPISLAMLVVPCALFEFNSIRTEWQYYGELMPIVWLIISGTVAFLLNYSSFIVSSVLTALTMTVAGNFKAVINIVASVLVFGNPIGVVNWIGCFVATGGVMWYNQLMMKQKKDAKA